MTALPGLYPEPIQVLAVPGALPRCHVVDRVTIADGRAGFAALAGPDFDPAHEVLLADGMASRGAPDFAGHCQIESDLPDRVVLNVDLNHEGVVVLADAHDPGWRVTVAGVPAALLRADMAFRAVRLPAGRHRIEMVYRPWPALLGAAVSGGSLAVLTLLGLGGAVRRKLGLSGG